jgi:RHS repeat-associated protein
LIGIGLRSSTPGYTDEGLRQQFTGYERDDETGLDYAQARYYSNIAGRFTSPDPLLSSASSKEPQSWNRYSYVGNRPTVLRDPSGLIWAKNSQGYIYWFTDDEWKALGPNSGWVALTRGEMSYWVGNDHYRLNPNGPNPNADPRDFYSWAGWRRIGGEGVNMMEEQFASAGIGAVGGRIMVAMSAKILGGLLGDIPITLGLSGAGTAATETVGTTAGGAGGVVVNLGSGTNPLRGAINVDKAMLEGVNVVADAEVLPFASATVGEVHAINPYGFNPVSAETARIIQPGGLLYVTGTARNPFTNSITAEAANTAGFRVLQTGPMQAIHNFGIQKATSGGVLNTMTSTTTVLQRLP